MLQVKIICIGRNIRSTVRTQNLTRFVLTASKRKFEELKIRPQEDQLDLLSTLNALAGFGLHLSRPFLNAVISQTQTEHKRN